MESLSIKETEVVEKTATKTKRYPNLSTVLLIEDFLKANQDRPMKMAEIRRGLPKQIMHQTLVTTLDYLDQSGKILIGTKGVQWIYADHDTLRKLIANGREL